MLSKKIGDGYEEIKQEEEVKSPPKQTIKQEIKPPEPPSLKKDPKGIALLPTDDTKSKLTPVMEEPIAEIQYSS